MFFAQSARLRLTESITTSVCICMYDIRKYLHEHRVGTVRRKGGTVDEPCNVYGIEGSLWAGHAIPCHATGTKAQLHGKAREVQKLRRKERKE